jgi:hypothetical protein
MDLSTPNRREKVDILALWRSTSPQLRHVSYKRARGAVYFASLQTFIMVDMLRDCALSAALMSSLLLLYAPAFVAWKWDFRNNISDPINFKEIIRPTLVYITIECSLYFTLKLSLWYYTKHCSAFLSKFFHSRIPFPLVWIVRRFIIDRIQDDDLFFWCNLLLFAIIIILFVPYFEDIVQTVKYRQRRKKFNLKPDSFIGLLTMSMFGIVLIMLLFLHDIESHTRISFLQNIICMGCVFENFEHSRIKVMYEVQKPSKRYILVKQFVCGNARICHVNNDIWTRVLYNSTNAPPVHNLYVPNYLVKVNKLCNLPSSIRRKIRQNALIAA